MSGQLANQKLVKRILGNDYLHVRLERLVVEENFDSHESKVRVEFSANGSGAHEVVEGVGVGMVDALYHGLLGRFAQEYESLNSIEFSRFDIQGKFDTKNDHAGADAMAEIKLGVKNSEGKAFEFSDASRSISSSVARAVVAVVEYFVNAERAFVMLYKSLKDAKERGREDLVSRYTQELSAVVQSTSYAEVIDKIQKDLP